MAEGNSPSDQFKEHINKMVTHLKNESRRRGKSAELLPSDLLRSYHKIISARKMANVFTPNCENRNVHFLSSLNKTIYPSKTPFIDLTRTVIPELRLEESATKKYIIARIIEEGYVVNGYQTVIEDDAGNVCNLLIHNFPFEELTGSIGIALIIKEPYFKIDLQGNPYIRCDCPTDIFILRPCFQLYYLTRDIVWKNKLEKGRIVHDVLMKNSLPKDPGQWCARGDQLVHERQLAAAREAYRLGTRCCGRDDPYYKTLRFKLLDLHLLLNWYEWAIVVCGDILAQFPDDRDTLFLLGQSYCKVRNYRRALAVYDRCCALFPGDEVMETQLLEVNERIREENGVFDIERLRRISVERPFDPIACAEYIGPIEIMKIPGKGRGMVLTKDVAKGSILFVSKALVTCYPRQKPQVAIGENNEEEDELDPTSSENIRKLTHLIYKNPNFFGAAVFNLFTGSHTDGVIQQFCNPEQKQEAICDVEKIRAIYQCNKFKITQTVNGKVIVKGEGLFLFASYLNHNCSPNVEIEFYNDIMVARSKMNLKSDTELAISYVPLSMDFTEKKKMLKRRGIITCLCTQCKRGR